VPKKRRLETFRTPRRWCRYRRTDSTTRSPGAEEDEATRASSASGSGSDAASSVVAFERPRQCTTEWSSRSAPARPPLPALERLVVETCSLAAGSREARSASRAIGEAPPRKFARIGISPDDVVQRFRNRDPEGRSDRKDVVIGAITHSVAFGFIHARQAKSQARVKS